jgi:hypothetical protein
MSPLRAELERLLDLLHDHAPREELVRQVSGLLQSPSLELLEAATSRLAELSDSDPREGDTTGTCRGCSRPVVWAEITTKQGKPGRVPLDARAPVYQVHPGAGAQAVRLEGAYVSHFATCQAANDYSKNRRK